MTGPTVTLRHRTCYRFEQPVVLGPHTIRLHPAPSARARILSYALAVRPEPLTLHWFEDPLANRLARAAFEGASQELAIDVALVVQLSEANPFDFVLDAAATTWPFFYPASMVQELGPYLQPPAVDPWLAGVLAGLDLVVQSPVDLLVALNQLVHGRVRYMTRMEPGVQTPAQTIELASGSCRDVAWMLVLAARSLGFAARFVSGYLVQLLDPEHPAPGLERDGADLHAWAEVFLPGAGWLGFDPTSGLVTGSGHIPLASGAHPGSAAPVDGTTTSGAARLETSLEVSRA